MSVRSVSAYYTVDAPGGPPGAAVNRGVGGTGVGIFPNPSACQERGALGPNLMVSAVTLCSSSCTGKEPAVERDSFRRLGVNNDDTPLGLRMDAAPYCGNRV